MDTSQATRDIMWNISNAWIMYALLVPALAIAGYGFYRRIALWRLGTAINRFDSVSRRLALVRRDVLFQMRLARDIFGGVFHRLIFWGFLIFLIATVIVMLQYDFNVALMKGPLYLYFQSLVVDVAGAAAFAGLLVAGVRRWIIKPPKLVYTFEASMMLVLLMGIIVSGFIIEGLRIAATEDPWGAWSPVGFAVANILQPSVTAENLSVYHRWFWWCHLLLVYGLIAWAPFTKLRHALTSVLNTYTANLKPIGSSLKIVDLEAGETLGVNHMNAFTWKDLLDLDACTECGQCTDNCPAATVEKELSPRDLMLQLRALLDQEGRASQNMKSSQDVNSVKLSDRIPADVLWQCTTCAACVDACPVHIEQMPKIVDMRRYLVMEEAEAPETILDAVMSVEDRGHPFRGIRSTRLDWTKGLDVPLISHDIEPEVLFWVGSAGALLERSQHVTRAFANLLKHAGVNYAILGREEKSTGDIARRIGNEYLFESMAKENIAVLERYHVKKIVTCCPHSYNTFKNEYPRLGGNYEVYHHTEYLWQLMAIGRLTIPKPLSRKIVYHDPCYLGRHNGVYDAPRSLLKSACTHLGEMKRSRRRAFCCGGGGGMSFAEDSPEKRINRERARHVLDTSADVLAVACPYCITMMEDGLKAIQGQREIIVKDVAELLWDALEA